jgi:predicted transposase/invertase (TIGR01784 family)
MDKEKFSDRGYRLLFSHPKMVEDLIKTFVKEDFIDKIDYTTLTPVKTSFVSSGFRSRETDVIWKVNICEKPVYIYIFIDFQSTVDKFMSLRLMTYIGLFYEHLLKEDDKLKNLPSVFPILLYNGEDTWTAPLEIEKLIDIPYQSIRRYLPHFRYYKIAENEFTKESLMEIRNLVSRLFLIETSRINELSDIIEDVIKILHKEVNKELQRDFGLWVRGILRKKQIDLDLTELDEMEVRPMLIANLERFEKEVYEKGIQEGIEKGIQEGIEKGIEEGIISSVKKLLMKGFSDKEIIDLLEVNKDVIEKLKKTE